jgi:hypothetical protein
LKMFFENSVINSARDCSKLVGVNPKKDYRSIEGKLWSNAVLINQCIQYLQCLHYFVQCLHISIGLIHHTQLYNTLYDTRWFVICSV